MTGPRVGQTIADRYELLEEIGAGGMATVWKAEHKALRKPVAIKLLHPELADDAQFVARFEQEARLAAQLDHSNCVVTTDFGREGKQFYLVMEYIAGVPLSTLLEPGRLPWPRAVELTRQILRGLGKAHEAGIVHRDLKPTNILIQTLPGGRDHVKIIDFGIAKMFAGTPLGPRVETEAGLVFGTADFLAPERLSGQSDADPRADLYSVAVLLYEMVTGTRPFTADDPIGVVRRALTEAPPPPTRHAPDLPVPLEAAILRGLEKRPESRYPAAREFLAALDLLAPKRIGPEVLAVPPITPVTSPVVAEPIMGTLRATPAIESPPPPARDRRRILFYVVPPVVLVLASLGILAATGEEKKIPLAPYLAAILVETRNGVEEADAKPEILPDDKPASTGGKKRSGRRSGGGGGGHF